jgi:hypothetical protein
MSLSAIVRFVLASLLFAGAAVAEEKEPPQRTRLYTTPDPANTGGLQGHIAKPALPIEQILATPATNPEEVYLGEITGANKDAFLFKNLPIGKYDLIVVYPTAFYEGFQLTKDASTLSAEDRKGIEATIQKSEPFFSKRVINRLDGETGRASFARCIVTYYREKGSELLMETYKGGFSRPDWRRTFKLVTLKQVGPGWQITRARDLYPVWVKPNSPLPEHHFSSAISQIRVADQVKNLGDLDLTR